MNTERLGSTPLGARSRLAGITRGLLYLFLSTFWCFAVRNGRAEQSPSRLERLFDPEFVERSLAGASAVKMGDWYDFKEGRVLHKSDLGFLSDYYVEKKLITVETALAGLKSKETYIRVTCKLCLEKLLGKELRYPHLSDPESKEAVTAFKRIEAVAASHRKSPPTKRP
jgi:hypothetical protein